MQQRLDGATKTVDRHQTEHTDGDWWIVTSGANLGYPRRLTTAMQTCMLLLKLQHATDVETWECHHITSRGIFATRAPAGLRGVGVCTVYLRAPQDDDSRPKPKRRHRGESALSNSQRQQKPEKQCFVQLPIWNILIDASRRPTVVHPPLWMKNTNKPRCSQG